MAIAKVRTNTTADLNAPGATIAVTLPTGGLSTEICILALLASNASANPVGSWTPPAGWTAIFSTFNRLQGGGGDMGCQGFWSLANNANLTFTKSGTVTAAGWVAVDFSGVDLTTPIDVTQVGQSIVTSQDLTLASNNIATDQAWDMAIGGDWQSGGTFTIPNFTIAVNANVNESAIVGYNTTPKSVGATGTVVMHNTAAASGQVLLGARFALRPTSPPPPPSSASVFLLTA